MQNKGAIRFFAIVLTLVCLYQLSFTVVTYMKEKEAKEASGGDPVKEKAYLDSLWSTPVYFDFTYGKCKEQEINLGLDLRGGMNVTLEVSVVDLIRSMSGYSTDTTFNKALVLAQEMQRSSQEDFVSLFVKAFTQIDPNGRLAAIFSTREMKDRIPFDATNEQVKAVIREEAEGAIDRSFKILRTRIDKFGVTQPNIQKLGGSGRILVELPGVKEPERVRKLLQGTAKLEFWETYDYKELINYFEKANKYLSDFEKHQSGLSPDSVNVASADTSKKSGTDAAITASSDTAKKDTSGGSLESLLAGTDSAGKLPGMDTTPTNPLYTVLQPAVYQDEKQQYMLREGPAVGYALIKDTAKVNAYLAMEQVKAIFPPDVRFYWTVKPIDEKKTTLELIAIKVTTRDNRAPLEGDKVSDARLDYGSLGNKPEVSMTMNAEGAKTWKMLTKENIGKSIAIVLDEYVYSYPNVQGEIPNGMSQITGNFTIEEARDLANVLQTGKLPAPAHIVEEAVVGPSLGREAIQDGFLSFAIALILVLAFMAFYYNTAGWVAIVALFSNVFFIMGVLASLTAVLTLPGIAGIVLTLGMAVDANVLIYERVREELGKGKGIKLAISDGFRNAMSSVVDSNLTTLLAGVILVFFGSGPIQGFATTLIIGILTSLFTAIFISRLIFEWMLGRNKDVKFSNRITEGAFKNIRIDFVSRRKLYYVISGIVIAVGITSMIVRNFSYGVDFTGGRTYVVRFDSPVNTVDVRKALRTSFGTEPDVKEFGGNEQVRITTGYLIDDLSTDTDARVEKALENGLSTIQGKKWEVMSSQKVGPTIADDIKKDAVWALLLSMVGMFLYILLRFRSVDFSWGAILALVHDVMFVLACFSLLHGIVPFNLDINQDFIAAILTVIGFSMNDTVVVFDRIREYLRDDPNRDTNTTINEALNATLSRTINTSLTIFFVLFSIVIFGGEVIRGFAFAMLLGIIVGTYSSVCIATPVVVDFQARKKRKMLEKKEQQRKPVTAA